MTSKCTQSPVSISNKPELIFLVSIKPSKPSTYFSRELLLNHNLIVISNISTSLSLFLFMALHVASWTIPPGRYGRVFVLIISKAPTLNHSGTWIDVTWMQRWHGRFMSKLKSGIPQAVTWQVPLFDSHGISLACEVSESSVFFFESSDRWNLQINSIQISILTIYHPGMFACCCARVSGFRWSLELHPENKMSMLYINVPVDDKGSYHQRV